MKHLLIPVLAVCALAASGCGNRQSSLELDEYKADNQRMAGELDRLRKENSTLVVQRDEAREALAKYRENVRDMEKQIGDLSKRKFGDAELVEVLGDNAVALKDLAFAKGSAELTKEGQDALREIAKVLNSGDYLNTRVQVVGHTDDTPVVRKETRERFGNNWGLSAMRAATVIGALQAAGLHPDRLHGGFRGEYQPRGNEKAGNRRVEIRVSM